MKVVITIPAYNEEKTLGKVLSDIKKVMNETEYDYQILVVNDGSRDKTEQVATKGGALVYSHVKNCGLAETFRTEMRECLKMNPNIIVHTDADGQYLAKEIPKLIKKVEEGNDLVLGSRFRGKIESMPFIKRWGNKQFSKVISKIIKQKITDGQTGFRAFTKEIAENKIISNHTYTQEQILRAGRENFKIVEVPIFFAKRGGKTKSRLMRNPFEYAVKAWINIFRIYRDYEPLSFFGTFGLFMIGIGALLSVYLLSLFIFVGSAAVKNKIPTILLVAIFVLSGIQIILFGFLADQRKN